MKDSLVFIDHILESIKDIESFTNNVGKNEFSQNKLLQNAVIRSIEIIGEATKNIPDPFKERYSDVEWRKIAGTRDKITHHYFGLDLDTIWDTLKEDIPVLKKKILKIKEQLNKK